MNSILVPSAQYLGAHNKTLEALARLRLLAQTAGSMQPGQRQRLATGLTEQISQGILGHQTDEEEFLFPQILARARSDEERRLIESATRRLVREHRALEMRWARLAPAVEALEAGREASLSVSECTGLSRRYTRHAKFEETQILPLASQLLDAADKPADTKGTRLRHDLEKPQYRFI